MLDWLFKNPREEDRKRIDKLEALIVEIKEDFALREQFYLEKIAGLEERLAKYETPKNSENSSIPPSQDPYRKKYPKREKGEKPAGAQKGHKGSHHAWTEKPDAIIPIHPESCPHCGSTDLALFPDYEEARQEIEIPPLKPFVKEYRALGCQCKHCGKRSRAKFPDHLKAVVQMGTSIEDFVGYLKTIHHCGHNKITEFFRDIFGLNLCHGSIHNLLERCQDRVLPTYQQLTEEVRNADSIHSDETVCPIDGTKKWIWVFATNKLYLYVASLTRSFKVIEETIGKEFNGSWISDRYGAQLMIVCRHQLCLAHIIRNLKYVVELENSLWSLHLQQFLQEIIHTRNQWGENWDSKNAEVQALIQQATSKLNTLFSHSIPPLKTGKKKSQERILFEQLNRHQDKLLHFLSNPHVPPTNNLAEQALRCFVVHRKVTGGFKTIEGAQGHAVLLSVIQTARKKGLNVLDVLSHKQPLFQPS